MVVQDRSQADILEKIGTLPKKRLRGQLSPLQRSIYPFIVKGKDFIIETGNEGHVHADLLLPPVMRVRRHQHGTQALIIRNNPDDVRSTAQLCRKVVAGNQAKGRKGVVTVVELGGDDSPRKEAMLVSRNPQVLVATSSRVIDHIRRDNINLRDVRLCVIEEPPEQQAGSFNADLEYIYSKFGTYPQTAVFTRERHDAVSDIVSLLRRPVTIPLESWNRDGNHHNNAQESGQLGKKSYDNIVKNEALAARLKEVVRQIHEEESPEEMNAYRKVIRKNIPFFARGYFAAFLLKYSNLQAGRPEGRVAQHAQKEKKEDLTSIFVSVGKNRKVFPRDLLQLFTTVDSVDTSHVGQIKILDNYSFVEVSEDRAKSIIDMLNGKEYRGRKLTVNYARKKD